ncbi:MAG: alpha/beta hydrolase family protein, partial [Syntrophomonadaceae bacterium]
ASHSFVVLSPSHADAAADGARDPASESAREPTGDAAHDAAGWVSRVRDLSFVAAATAAVESAVPALQGKLDEGRVGVAGQSYGAFASMLLAGATVDVSKKEKGRSFADPIPKAFLLISPPGRGQQGLTEKSWAAVERPLMVVTGTRDPGVRNQDPSWRLDAYQLSPAGGKFAVFIEGASHLSLTGLSAEPGAAPPKTPGKKASSPDAEIAIFKDMKIATLAFWEAYLKQDAAALAFLQSDAIQADSNNRAQLLRR